MKTRSCSYIFLLIFAMVSYISGKNILFMSLTPSPSHNIWDKTLAMGLRNKGHSITYVTHSPEKTMENFTIILMDGVYEKMNSAFDLQDMVDHSYFQIIVELYDWIHLACESDLDTEGLKTLLKQAKDGVKYDAIIWDITCGQCLFPIIEKFGSPPTIAVSAFGLGPFLIDAYGLKLNHAYIPSVGFLFSDQMTFLQRLYNYIGNSYFMILKHVKHIPGHMELAKRVFGDDVKHISVYEKNFSVFLTNYDPVLTYPQPLPPAIIPVGGLHAKRANELPQDLKIYMDNSKDGVIVFSLGTNVRSDKLGLENQKILLAAFAELKQNVIWKFESHLKDIPKNVIIRKFLPQNDLLAHPNVKMLMNHGGGLSTQEGLYHGLPIIAMPFFSDQRSITHELIIKKLGLRLDFQKLNKKYVLSRINEVLTNDIYRRNAQMVSRRYRDRPDNALDRAVFWVEHVIREGGSDYLRIAARDMPYYQTELLDIWAFIIIVIVLLYFIIKRLLQKLCKNTVQKFKNN